MKKEKWKFAVTLVVIAVLVVMFFKWSDTEKYKAEHPQDEVTHGMVSVYNNEGFLYYQYAGNMEINIQDDECEVIVVIPAKGDSCFDERTGELYDN